MAYLQFKSAIINLENIVLVEEIESTTEQDSDKKKLRVIYTNQMATVITIDKDESIGRMIIRD